MIYGKAIRDDSKSMPVNKILNAVLRDDLGFIRAERGYDSGEYVACKAFKYIPGYFVGMPSVPLLIMAAACEMVSAFSLRQAILKSNFYRPVVPSQG